MKVYLELRFLIFANVLCLFGFINTAIAAQWAVVKVDKAVIYSDKTMVSSIGFIAKGKKVRVGEVVRNKGRVLPIVINNRIAYIKVRDINISSNLENLKKSTNRFSENIERKLSETRIMFLGSTMLANIDLNDDIDDVKNYNALFLGGAIKGKYVDLPSRRAIRSGIEYHTGQKNEHTLSWVSIPTGLGFNLIDSLFYKLNYHYGLDFVPYAEYKYKDLFKVQGYGFGFHSGVDMSFDLSKSFSINIEANYQYAKFFNFNLPTNVLYPEKIEPSLHGAKILAGLVYIY